MRWLRITLMVLVWIVAAPLAAADDAVAPGADGRLALGRHIGMLEDPDGTLGIDAVAAPEAAGRFRPAGAEAPSLGFSTSAWWVRLTLAPQQGERLLEIAFPFIDKLRLYVPRPDGGFDVRRAGDFYPYAQREIGYRHVVFRLDDPGAAPRTVYLRLETEGALALPLVLWTPRAFFEYRQQESRLLGAYYGLILGILLYNLGIWLQLGERLYLAYVLYLGSYALLQASLNGLGFEYLWPDAPAIANRTPLVLAPLAAAAAAYFARCFLGAGRPGPRRNRVLLALSVLCLAALPFEAFGGYRAAELAAMVLGVTVVAVNLPFGWYCWRRGDRPALYLVLAWAVFLVAIVVTVAAFLGGLAYSPLVANALQLGSAVEVLLLALGLVQRIARLKQDKLRAEAEAKRVLEVHNRELAGEVEARTRELRRTAEAAEALSRELAEKNETLSRLAAHDGLTGLLNHRTFISRLQALFADARRHRFSLCVVMVDLDHFKSINDAHGHPFGDLVLKRVADVLAKGSRAGDLVARYGGEEFALALPHCDAAVAVEIAERLRAEIAASRLPEQPALRLSASFGLACQASGAYGIEPARLLGRADAALYQAKREGRNRVVVAGGMAVEGGM